MGKTFRKNEPRRQKWDKHVKKGKKHREFEDNQKPRNYNHDQYQIDSEY